MPTEQPEITPEMLAQHPELALAIVCVYGLLLFYLVGSIASWIYFGTRVKAGKPMLDTQPWSPRAWGLADVLVALVAVVLGQIVFARVGLRALGIDVEQIRSGEASMPISLATWLGVGNVVAMLATVVWIVLRHRVTFAHVGFSGIKFLRQLGIGFLVGLASLPVVYVMMMLVSLGFKTQYTHPLIDEISKNGTLATYGLGFLTAAIIAPLTEEFLFRVVLQGWLQSIPFKSAYANVLGGLERAVWHGAATSSSGGEVVDAALVTTPSEIAAGSVTSFDPYKPTSTEPSSAANTDAVDVPPIWPSVVAGTLFGLAHWGYGLSFIPLIVFGTILGLVYRATHSIWPCVLIHFMLNATSISMLGVAILIQRATGAA